MSSTAATLAWSTSSRSHVRLFLRSRKSGHSADDDVLPMTADHDHGLKEAQTA